MDKKDVEKPVICPICAKEYKNDASYRKHKSTIHGENAMKKCGNCSKEFGSNNIAKHRLICARIRIQMVEEYQPPKVDVEEVQQLKKGDVGQTHVRVPSFNPPTYGDARKGGAVEEEEHNPPRVAVEQVQRLKKCQVHHTRVKAPYSCTTTSGEARKGGAVEEEEHQPPRVVVEQGRRLKKCLVPHARVKVPCSYPTAFGEARKGGAVEEEEYKPPRVDLEQLHKLKKCYVPLTRVKVPYSYTPASGGARKGGTVEEKLTEELSTKLQLEPSVAQLRDRRGKPKSLDEQFEEVNQSELRGLEIVKVPEKGNGVRATRIYEIGNWVFEYKGELLGYKEAVARDDKYREEGEAGSFMYFFKLDGKPLCFDATKPSRAICRMVNHSRRNPNTKPKAIGHRGTPRVVFIACQRIKIGDEILYDYGDRTPQTLRDHPWLKN